MSTVYDFRLIGVRGELVTDETIARRQALNWLRDGEWRVIGRDPGVRVYVQALDVVLSGVKVGSAVIRVRTVAP